MPLSNKIKPINLSLFSDYNPKTTTKGLGFKNKEKSFISTINTIKNRSTKYQVNVIMTMLGRAKPPNKTRDMNDAIKLFSEWMKQYKRK